MLKPNIIYFKYWYFVLLLLFSSFTSGAQGDTITGFISGKSFRADYNSFTPVGIDTIPAFFHQYNPLFKSSFSISYLGNFGSPALSNIFANRIEHRDFFFLTPYMAYLHNSQNTVFYNTKRQYTMLTFISGGGTQAKEEILKAFHTQNINPALNFGLDINTATSAGQYAFQQTRRNSFKLFASYESSIWQSFFSVNSNNFSVDENGGMLSDSLFFSRSFTPRNQPTVILGQGANSNASNRFKHLNAEIVNVLNLVGHKGVPHDSLQLDRPIKRAGLVHVIGYETAKRMFSDGDPAVGQREGFYDTLRFNPLATYDSVSYSRFINRIGFYLEKIGSYTFTGALVNDWVKHAIHSRDLIPSIVDENSGKRPVKPFYYQHTRPGVAVHLGFTGRLTALRLKGDATYVLAGQYTNDLHIGTMALFDIVPDKYYLQGEFSSSIASPSYLLGNYISNTTDWWGISFKPEKKSGLSMKLGSLPNKFEMEVNYTLLRSVLFMSSIVKPEQHTGNVHIGSALVQKRFDFWKFSSVNNIAYQYVSNQDIVSLPQLACYNSTFFSQRVYFNFTGGEFLLVTGFDIHYNSTFYPPAYSTYTGTFYNQTLLKTGNYPFIDAYLNIKLKRARFFFKYEHVNSGMTGTNYYSAAHYPRNERVLRTGISWAFYD